MAWFDATQHNPELQAQGMPVGKYPVKIVNSGSRPTNDQTGGLLFLTCEILDGPNRGMSGQLTLNLWNKNDTSKEIAGRQLSAICHVTQTLHLDAKPEGVELWQKPFIIEIAPQPDSKYTQLVGVFDVAGNPPTRAQAAPAAAANQPPAQFAGQQPPQQQPAYAPQQQPQQQPAFGQGQPQPAFGQQPQQPPQPQQPQPSWAQQPAAGPKPAWAGP